MDKITSDVPRQQWLDIIQACNASGLTKKAWCEQNGINNKIVLNTMCQLQNCRLNKGGMDNGKDYSGLWK